MRITQSSQLRTNITSSIAVSPDQSFFIAVTRRQADNSSMFSYQLQKYQISSLELKNVTQIYDSYSQLKHPCWVLTNNQIVVANKYYLIFYDQKLYQKYKILHMLEDIYELSSSPDSQLVTLVGDNKILIYDAQNYRSIIFQEQINTARSAKFSKDNKYLGVSSTTSIYFYQIQKIADYYGFTKLPNLTAEDTQSKGYGSINSFEWHPYLNNKIVIGFGSSSPKTYELGKSGDNKFVKLAKEDQPSYMNNYKVVSWMPDGVRVFSSDYLQGVGVWPGDQTKSLFYVQNFLFFGPRPFDGGRKVIGYNWQTIKIINVQLPCPSSPSPSTTCSCPSSQYYSPSAQACLPCQLTSTSQNTCKCPSSQYFDPYYSRCLYQCPSSHSLTKIGQPLISPAPACYCERGYTFKNGSCVFDCDQIIFTVGKNPNSNEQCQCQRGFEWDKKGKSCSCQEGSRLEDRNGQLSCGCLQGFKYDQNLGKCLIDCSLIQHAINDKNSTTNTCACEPTYKFQYLQSPSEIAQLNKQNTTMIIRSATTAKCIKNCTLFNDTLGTDLTNSTLCQCKQNTKWDPTASLCKLQCNKITNAITYSVDKNNIQSCTCSSLYNWVPQIMQCGRNCDNQKFINKSKFSNALSCPCIDHFEWNDASKNCQINCQKMNYSASYNPSDNSSCICRNIYIWESQKMECVINCSAIWDAKQRVNQRECSCNNNKQFNETSNTCVNQSVEGVFSRPWIWAVLGVGVLFLVIVLVVLGRFCWKFREGGKDDGKRIKKNGASRKKKNKRNKKDEEDVVGSQRISLS